MPRDNEPVSCSVCQATPPGTVCRFGTCEPPEVNEGEAPDYLKTIALSESRESYGDPGSRCPAYLDVSERARELRAAGHEYSALRCNRPAQTGVYCEHHLATALRRTDALSVPDHLGERI